MASVHKRGTKWVVRVHYGRDPFTGKKLDKWVGGFRTRREAEREGTRLEAAKHAGEPMEEAPTRLAYGTLLNDKWLPHLANRVQMGSMRPSTYDFYADIVRSHLVPGLGHVRAQALDGSTLEAFYAEKLRSGRKAGPGQPATGLGATRVRAIHVTVNASLRWAVRQRLITRNPASEVTALPKPSGEQRPCWTASQTASFLEATKGDRLHALYLVAITTGMRRGEVVGLGWEQVDLEAGTLTVSRARISIRGRTVESTPKTAKGHRTIALAPVVIDALKAWHRRQLEERLAWGPGWTDSGFVFTWEDGRPYQPQYTLRSFQRAAQRAGLPVIPFHGLRHGAATAGLAAGVPLLAMSKRLGHSSQSITGDLYTRMVEEIDREAAERIALLLVPPVPKPATTA